MEVYNLGQRKNIIKWYHQGHSLRNITNLFHGRYLSRPSTETVSRIIKHFESHGCITPRRHKRQRAQLRNNDVRNLLICAAVEQNSTATSAAIAEELSTSATTVRRVLKINHYTSYKFKKANEIFPEDTEKRLQFCQEMIDRQNDDPEFFEKILFTDESTFALRRCNNSSLNRYWSTKNLHKTYVAGTQYPQKLNVWVGLLGNHIIGPFFIDGNLNSNRYLNLLQNQIVPAISNLPDIAIGEIWLQQDGCPAHNAVPVTEYLNNVFPNRVLSTSGTICWPPRSPDLAPNDFFLWGFIKNKVYDFREQQANTLAELEQKIIEALRTVTPEMLSNTRNGFYDRLGYCSLQLGGRFEHLLR